MLLSSVGTDYYFFFIYISCIYLQYYVHNIILSYIIYIFGVWGVIYYSAYPETCIFSWTWLDF